MNAYEKMLTEFGEDLVIDEAADLPSRMKGLFVSNNNCKLVLLNRDLNLVNEKSCILAEEIGHHCTSVGNILDQSQIMNRKQEIKAKRWAVNRLIRIEQFVDAYKSGVNSKAELADFLNVTEPFLDFAIEYFKNLYGTYHVLGNYIIYFDPLGVYNSLI